MNEDFGVFVDGRTDADAADGSRERPFASIAEGIAAAAAGPARRVFVCADGATYPELVQVTDELDGVEVYGSFACDDWRYDETLRAKVVSPEPTGWIVRGLTRGLLLENLDISAADAAEGESSFGMIVAESESVVLRRVRISAGRGGAGAPGQDGSAGADGLMAGGQQSGAPAICPATVELQVGGAWASKSTCGSRGGNGGQAVPGLPGGAGLSGIPTTNVTPAGAENGGKAGASGGPGAHGKAGAGGPPTAESGVFSIGGFMPAPAAGSGSPGFTGQGGGGGGSSDASGPPGTCVGATGGAGGMGGCGGLPGTGGSGGGASVALLAWMSGVELVDSALGAAIGGDGGRGGDGGPGGLGQAGGTGGSADAANGVAKGGDGGRGGDGGPGGPGAGGNGGPSYALVFKGEEPTQDDVLLVVGAPGAAGSGGVSPAGAGESGLEGEGARSFEVP